MHGTMNGGCNLKMTTFSVPGVSQPDLSMSNTNHSSPQTADVELDNGDLCKNKQERNKTITRKTKTAKTSAKKSKNNKERNSDGSAKASSRSRCDAFIDPDSEHVEYSIFSKLEDVENYIMEQEIAQTTKFILNRICKGFGNPDPDVASQKKQRVKWIASGVKFMGKPFVLLGDKRFDCRHGKDKNVAKKVRYNEKRKCLVDSGEQQRINNVRKADQLKMNCPAKIQIRDILVYTEFGVEGAVQGVHDLPSLKDPTNSEGYVKHNAQRRLRDRTSARLRALLDEGKVLKTDRQFHVTFPKLDAHKGHEVGQAAGTHQPVDRRLILHMQKLVSEGVIHIDHMKSRLDEYVLHLFNGKPLPEKDNRRYYPLTKDLSNHIQKAMASLMNSKQSAETFQLLYENLQRENPSDDVFYRPSVAGESRLIYVHQTRDQKWLLNKHACGRCALDVKYRAKKSSLPMFLISVQTDAGFQTIGTFILENEVDVREAISTVKGKNPGWSPKEWIIEQGMARVSALQTLFPESAILFKESLPKSAAKRTRKRTPRKSIAPPPRDPGETLRDVLKQLDSLSYHLPNSPQSWNLVNSVEAALAEAKTITNIASITTVLQTQLNTETTSSCEIKTKKPLKRTLHSHLNDSALQPPHQSLLSAEDATSASKIQRTDALTLHSTGLDDIANAVDQISRNHHSLFTDQQHLGSQSYMNVNHQLITQGLMPHQPQQVSSGIVQQSHIQNINPHLATASAASGTSHGLIGMSHSSSLPLQVTGMLPDSYQIHNGNAVSVGSMYGGSQLLPHQPQRHYLDSLQHPDSQTFMQRMAKISE